MLPLYDKTREDPPLKSYDLVMNTGLWYDKFCSCWKSDWSGLGDEGKKKWINSVCSAPVGNRELLDEMLRRRKQLIESNGGTCLMFKTTGSFVTGLGRSHPVENGFAWHHTLGVAHLPGSSVKGIVRNWAKQWAEWKDGDDGTKTIERIFGPDNKSKEHNIGSVIFLDALPIEPVQLKPDVMTPHYDPYYKGNGPPADWYDPIPIPFLVVDSDQKFIFGLMPRNPDNPQDTDDCKTAGNWLREALENIGAGAKTAVGYGRFKGFVMESSEEKWLANTTRDIAKSQNITADEVFRNTPNILKEKWINIQDGVLKKAVGNRIIEKYTELNMWDTPIGAVKKFKALLLEK